MTFTMHYQETPTMGSGVKDHIGTFEEVVGLLANQTLTSLLYLYNHRLEGWK